MQVSRGGGIRVGKERGCALLGVERLLVSHFGPFHTIDVTAVILGRNFYLTTNFYH